MEKVKINLFEQLTAYLKLNNEQLPNGVNLDLMTVSSNDDILADFYEETIVRKYPIEFRGNLGKPLIPAYYDFVFNGPQLVKASLIDN